MVLRSPEPAGATLNSCTVWASFRKMQATVLYKPKYDEILKEIEFIQDQKGVKRDYHAFVYWFVATLYGKEEHVIKHSLCDGTHDKGIDAIIIDDIQRTVSVVQSKFERKGNETQLNENDVKLLAVVKDYFKSRSALAAVAKTANPATQLLLDEAFSSLSKGHTLELVFITTHKQNPSVEPLLRKTFQFMPEEFRVFCYDNILAVMADKTRDFLPMNKPYNLSFKAADGTLVRTGSSNSWVLSVRANDIRDMAINYPDHLLFRKNVRDFLWTKSETNKRMLETLKSPEEQMRFWFYNNGITILCNSAKVDLENKYIHLVDPEVINGCQTVTSIRNFKEDSEADVLVRVVASLDHQFMDSMILYQNSSNPVVKRDLRSNDPVQIRLHHEFFKRQWWYEIKRGQEFDRRSKEDRNIRDQCIFAGISNSEIAKAFAAVRINPAIAASKGDDYFFGEAYQDVFATDLSTSDCLAPLLLKWFIRDCFGDEKYKTFDKAWLFKNPATHFVLNEIFSSLKGSTDWEKRWVRFWEDDQREFLKGGGDDDSEPESTGMWDDFDSKMTPIVDSLFDVSYKGWRAENEKSEIDYNTFFKSEENFKTMVKEDQMTIQALQKKVTKAFEKTALSPLSG